MPNSAYYADAVSWLSEAGITTGVGGNRFAPDDLVTRAQMATFLWRLCGRLPGGTVPFVDLETGAFYVEAVKWLFTVGVTNGKSATRFVPHDTVTRGEMAAFLYRLASNPDAWTAVTPPSVVRF